MSHRRKKRSSVRRAAFLTAAIATALFFGCLFGARTLMRRLPERRAERIEAALSAGDIGTARRLAEGFRDEARRTEALQRVDYADALRLFTLEEWDEAGAAFLRLGNYENSAELARESVYQKALAAMGERRWEDAAALFGSLSGFRDSYDRLDEIGYLQAVEEAESGEKASALQMFLRMGDYADARQRAEVLAVELTGESDPETALLLARDLTPEEIARREQMIERRAQLPTGVLDVGFYHTVGLRYDGTVLAAGDNEYGQCEVSDWHDMTQIAAGAYHTVGLRRDGTVAAVGRNTENQCEVAGWTGVKMIAAADYATFGLLEDGTVVHTGFNDYAEADGWTGVTFITGGSYALGGLRGGGTALISHLTARSDELTELVDLCVNTAFAVGCREDGTVVSPAVALDWTGIVSVSASGTAILGVRSDGTVAAHFFRPGDDPGVGTVKHVLTAAAGGTHFAFLHDDGTVTVLGENGHGEAETGAWRLLR